jgi:hypothetical protein
MNRKQLRKAYAKNFKMFYQLYRILYELFGAVWQKLKKIVKRNAELIGNNE